MSNALKSLVHGYIRTECIHHVSLVLKNLCFLFFNDELVWIFRQEKLSHLLSMKHGTCIKSKEIAYNDISLTYELYPNGKKRKYKGYVQFYLFVSKMNRTNVQYVTIGFSLCCDETKTTFNTLSRYFKSNIGNGWMNHLTLSKCKKYKKLTFRCSINSLQIKYKRKDNKLAAPKVISFLRYKPFFKRNLNFSWNVNKLLLKQFLKCKKGERFCSPQFNNWSFDIAVSQDELKICLVLLRWPSCAVSQMKIECSVTEQIQNIEMDEINKFENAEKYVECLQINLSHFGLYIDCNKNKTPTFLLNDTFILSANIEILEMFDDDTTIIPIDEWHAHHFDID